MGRGEGQIGQSYSGLCQACLCGRSCPGQLGGVISLSSPGKAQSGEGAGGSPSGGTQAGFWGKEEEGGTCLGDSGPRDWRVSSTWSSGPGKSARPTVPCSFCRAHSPCPARRTRPQAQDTWLPGHGAESSAFSWGARGAQGAELM